MQKFSQCTQIPLISKFFPDTELPLCREAASAWLNKVKTTHEEYLSVLERGPGRGKAVDFPNKTATVINVITKVMGSYLVYILKKMIRFLLVRYKHLICSLLLLPGSSETNPKFLFSNCAVSHIRISIFILNLIFDLFHLVLTFTHHLYIYSHEKPQFILMRNLKTLVE